MNYNECDKRRNDWDDERREEKRCGCRDDRREDHDEKRCGCRDDRHDDRRDKSDDACVTDLRCDALGNGKFRDILWTGRHLQVTLMCVKPGCDIGAECHKDADQLLYVEQGTATVRTGECRDRLCGCHKVCPGFAALIPAGTWHNVINNGCTPLKLFSVYAPPMHKKDEHKEKDC